MGHRKVSFSIVWLLFLAPLLAGILAYSQHVQWRSVLPAKALTGPINVSGTDYYVVTSLDSTEDTGNEVCAKVGRSCVGYTNYTNAVCTAVHPGAATQTSGSGDKSGVYCDGAPQSGLCSSLSNTCSVCTSCGSGVSCSDPIGGLYREMYVECGALLSGTQVTLNSGNATVVLGNDIASQTTGLSGIGAYAWTKDASRFTTLNVPMDNSGVATDFSGYGSNLTVAGASYQSSCKVGGCFSFNGASSYLRADLPTQIKTANITMEVWVNLSSVGTSQVIFAGEPRRANAVGLGAHIGVSPAGNPYFTKGTGSAWVSVTGNTVMTSGTWYHLVGTFDGSTMKIYVNGVLDNSLADATAISWTDGAVGNYPNPAQLYVGAFRTNNANSDGTSADSFFTNGLIDEARIYPRALSSGQILKNYNDGNAGNGGPTAIDTAETASGQLWNLTVTPVSSAGVIGTSVNSDNTVLVSSGISNISGSLNAPDEGGPAISTLTIPPGSTAAYRWLLNGSDDAAIIMPFNSGSSQTDFSAYANTGSVQSGAAWTNSGCKVGGCMTFNGSTGYVSINDSTSLSTTGGMTVTAWVKPTTTSAYQAIVSSYNTATSSLRFQMYLTPTAGLGGHISSSGTAGVGLENLGSVPAGSWTFVAMRFDPTLQLISYFVNGSLVGTVGTGFSTMFDNSRGVYIGARQTSTNSQDIRFNGSIDEVQLYPRSLSYAQIFQIYQDGANAVSGPTRISAQDHALGNAWDLIATEILSDGTVQNPGYVGRSTVTTAATTTLGITTPSGTQVANVPLSYSCSATNSQARDLSVEYSTNGGSTFSAATVASATSGAVVPGSLISMVGCNSGTSNNSFVWNSLADGVTTSSTVQIRITAQYPGGPSATTSNFTVENPLNLCTAGGEAAGGLTAAETSFDNTDILISGCTLSIDGTHSFASVTVGNGVGTADSTLTQSDTTTTTVYRTILNVSGAVTVNSDGLINMDEKGFTPGYISDGLGGLTTVGGTVDRSGGSHGGRGGTDSVGDDSPQPYDSISAPFDPGAGGGPQSGSGDGGGVIIISAANFSNDGIISANGKRSTTASTGGGAGGTIRITATGTVSGSGTIRANGASASASGGAGGGGRVAMIYNASVSGNDALGFSLQTYGGLEDGNVSDRNGGAGTVYLEKTNVDLSGQGSLIIGNNNQTITATRVTPITSGATFADVTIKDRAMGRAATFTAANLTLQNNATLFHDFTTSSTVYRLTITATGTVSIDSTSSINLDGRGFVNDRTSDGAGGTTVTNASADREGGSHGGRGGTDSAGDSSGLPYDSLTQPADPGGGPGAGLGAGGGYVKLVTANLVVNGNISANGTAGADGGGAGGGIWIIATGQISGTGTVRANGAAALTTDGSGAGGRIALHYDSSVSGNGTLTPTFQAYGADQADSNSDRRGGAGTIYFEQTNSQTADQGDVIIDNNNLTITAARVTPIPASSTYASVLIKNRAVAQASTFTAGNLTLQSNATLQHDYTTTTTVYRLNATVTGTLSVDATSSINLDGRGFTANRTSDGAGGVTTVGGSTDRAGGSHGGRGGEDSGGGNDPGVQYDSISQPADPGAGSGVLGTGVGGGYAKITTSNLVLNGTISANGATSANGSGAGGGIWIIATGQISGAGTVRANGVAANSDDGSGAGGRVALQYNSSLSGNDPLTISLQAFGGDNAGSTDFRGGAGTVYLEKTDVHAAGQGDVVIANNGVTLNVARYTTYPTSPAFSSLTIKDAAVVQASTFTVGDFTMQNSAILQHDFTTTSTIYKLNITATGTVSIDSTSSINVDGRGFTNGRTSDGAGGITTTGATADRSGGSHGGRGGSDSAGDDSGIMYDDMRTPTDPGAGGGATGTGGGYVKISTVNFSHSGTITAGGVTGVNGAGAGGGIWIITSGTVSGTGTIRANGGAASDTTDGSGGGGRIAFYYNGALAPTITQTLQVYGGANAAASDRVGGAGTIYQKDSSQSYADLVIDNNSQVTNSARATRLFVTVPSGLPTTFTLRNLSVINQAILLIDNPCAGTPAVTVTGTTDLSGGGTITNNQPGTCTVTQSAISITTTSLPTALANTSYNQSIASSGGYGPHTFDCRSGGLTVACTTVLPAGLDMNSSGVISGTPTVVGTSTFTVRATEVSPGSGFAEKTLSITVGNAPTAPTNLFSNATDAQSCCSSATTDATPVFSAIFNDPDTGNATSKYRIQVASDNGFSTILWDSGSSGTSMSAIAIGARSPNIPYGGSALSLGGITYYWRIKFWDNTNIEGPFSSTATFITSTAPTAPTNLFSNDSSAQTGLTNPLGVNAARPLFSAIFHDPDIGDTATKYRIQVSTTNDFSALVWDSGAAGTSMTTCTEGLRCADITYGATTALGLDGTKYYWRIKFFDAAGLESAWSEDPISTNSFTMSSGGSSVQRLQEQVQQNTKPAAPKASSVQVVNSTTLRYNWLDLSNNETGFRLLDDKGQTIVEVGAGVTSAQEINLTPNTPISGRRVVAFNSVGVSDPSDVFPTTSTAAPAVKPVLVRRGADSVTFTVTPPISNLTQGSSGVLFEILVQPSDPTQKPRVLTSDWVQTNEYTFKGLSASDTVQVRVTTRNQSGLTSTSSEYLPIEALAHDFHVALNVVKKGTNQLPRPLSPQDVIKVTAVVKNTGTQPATNVFASLLLPKYMLSRPGTLVVDGKTMTDFTDEDAGQVDNGFISVIWSRFAPAAEHTVSFELTFDQQALQVLKDSARSAANPLINLQMTVGFAESDAVFTSPAVTLEPDLNLLATNPQSEPVSTEEPVAPPTKNDSNEVSNILDGLIQQESQQQSSAPAAPTAPQGPTTKTNVSYDGGSFNVDVTRTDGNKLLVSGSATPTQNQIEFTGTTSLPNSVVTLIFNNSVTVIVTSDENGEWRTYVSADQLGIKKGQAAQVKIEAIAANGDLRSDKVQVGNVLISLADTNDVQTQFETTVTSTPVLTAVNAVRKEVAKQIVKQEPVIQQTLATAAPVVIVSSVPLWGYLPYLPTMIYHFITYVVGLIGRKRKKQQRFYGIVYDSISKQPLALAIIRIYNKETNRLVATQVSDKHGRYDVLLQPASYRLEVTKPSYSFPSHIVSADIDGPYQHVYHNEQGLAVQSEEIIVPDVPLDPVNAQRQWQISGFAKKLWLALQNVGNYIAVPVLMVGALASVVVLMTIPNNPINWLLSILYVGMFAAQLKLRPHIQKAWGVVYDLATNAALPLTTIQLIDPQYGKVVTSRLTDYQGRYSFMPEPGHYVVKASKPGFEQVKEVIESPGDTQHHPVPPQLDITKPDERITGDVPMKIASS